MASLRVLVRVLIVGSLCIAALVGALTLLSPGDFGATEARVLLTTLLVGLVSLAGLCLVATGGTPAWPLGAAGVVTSAVTVVDGLGLIWTRVGDTHESVSWETFGVAGVLTVALAHVALLLLVAKGRVPALLVPTVAVVALVTTQLCYLVLVQDIGDGFLRALGVAAIADVLGTVLVCVASRWQRALSA